MSTQTPPSRSRSCSSASLRTRSLSEKWYGVTRIYLLLRAALGLGFVRLMSGFQARLFEVEVVLDAVHGVGLEQIDQALQAS